VPAGLPALQAWPPAPLALPVGGSNGWKGKEAAGVSRKCGAAGGHACA
jgi:hypothetical protein